MPAETRLFLCLKDNYGVLLHDPESGATASIDAPEAAPIEAALKATGWKLTDILVTHHHADHTGGILALKEKYKCRVVAPAAEADTIPAVDLTVREGDKVTVGKLSGNVIETPGHTNGHIAYWFHADKLAFVGDTLFSIGCGRVIEGTPGMMWRSLIKLRDLPNDTEIYCGHEYTAANIRFALTIEPDNAVLAAREAQVQQQIAQGEPTIPVTIGDEKLANPFLRADLPEVAAGIGMAGKPALAGVRGNPGEEEQVLTALMPPPPTSSAQARSQAASGGRPLPRDLSRSARDRRPRRLHFDLFSAGARRALALASHRRRRDLALLRRRALKLEVVDGAKEEIVRLGADIHAGEAPQVTVPARAWQAAECLATGRWSAARSRPAFPSKASSWRRRAGRRATKRDKTSKETQKGKRPCRKNSTRRANNSRAPTA